MANSATPIDYVIGHEPRDTPPSPAHDYQRTHTLRRTLAACLPVRRPCNLADCKHCGENVARDAIQEMQDRFADFSRCSSIRLSVARNVNLAAAINDLALVRSRFLKLAHLGDYLLNTEITHTAEGWNPHIHLLTFDARPLDEITGLWDRAGADLRIETSHHAQRSDTLRAIEYILKPRLGTGPGSLRSILARAANGDALAADLWAEFDQWRTGNPRTRFRFSHRRTTAAPAAAPRDQHHTAAADQELAQLAILQAFGVTSRRAQAATLGIGDSTIARRRRHFPARSLGEPGRIPFRIGA